MTISPETEAAPRYEIVETIGRGGMGEVCLDDLMLHRQVALKFVTSAGGDVLQQLLSEARAAACLDHPFICSIYEVTTLKGRPCIVMEPHVARRSNGDSAGVPSLQTHSTSPKRLPRRSRLHTDGGSSIVT